MLPLFLVLSILALFAGAYAQSSPAVPTSTAGLSPCLITCVGQAAATAGCSLCVPTLLFFLAHDL